MFYATFNISVVRSWIRFRYQGSSGLEKKQHLLAAYEHITAALAIRYKYKANTLKRFEEILRVHLFIYSSECHL